MAICVLYVVTFYARSSVSYGKSVAPARNRGDLQNLQADAFLHGRLDLAVTVPPGLAALDDPYDATANAQYRAHGLHDMTYYGGKIYSYFGPAPIVLLFIPYRALGVGDLSPTLAALIFCIGGFLASWGAFRIVTARFVGRLPLPVEALSVIALGMAAPIGWLVYIGRGYEAVIACGYFMTSLGLYFLSRGLFGGSRWPAVDLAISSVAFAGGVAARPTLALTFGFSLLGLVCVAKGGTSVSVDRRRSVMAICAPWVVIGVLVGWYNWARFGSAVEFGTSYQLSGENVRFARANEVSLLVRGLYYYLISPWRWRGHFGQIALRPVHYPSPVESGYIVEPVAGLLPLFPASLLGSVVYLARPLRVLRRSPWLTSLIAVLVGVAFLLLAATSYHIHGATMRYQMDYAPIFLLASVTGYVAVLVTGTARRWRVPLLALGVVALAWSMYMSVAITAFPCAGTGSC